MKHRTANIQLCILFEKKRTPRNPPVKYAQWTSLNETVPGLFHDTGLYRGVDGLVGCYKTGKTIYCFFLNHGNYIYVKKKCDRE